MFEKEELKIILELVELEIKEVEEMEEEAIEFDKPDLEEHLNNLYIISNKIKLYIEQ